MTGLLREALLVPDAERSRGRSPRPGSAAVFENSTAWTTLNLELGFGVASRFERRTSDRAPSGGRTGRHDGIY